MTNLNSKLWRPFGSSLATDVQDFLTRLKENAPQRLTGQTGPRPSLAFFKERKLGAVRLEAANGGLGYSVRDLFSLVIDIAALDSDLAHILRTHYWFTEELLTYGDRKASERWLERIRGGMILGNAASEIGTSVVSANIEGNNTPPVRTSFGRRSSDGSLSINGSKFYSTGSLYSDWILVMAIDAEGNGKWIGVRADDPGVVHENDWDGIGQRDTGSGTTRFIDASADIADVLPLEFSRPYGGSFTQLYLLAVAAGIARNVADDAASHLRGRSRNYTHGLNAVPSDDPILQIKIGELGATAFAAESVVLAAADALDRVGSVEKGSPDYDEATHDAAMAVSRAQIAIQPLILTSASDIFEIGGSSASRQGERLDRHWRNVRTITTHNTLAFRKQNVGAYDVNGTRLPLNGFF